MDDKMIVGGRDSWPIAEQGGPLVKIQISPNVCVRMREKEARELGLLPEASKGDEEKAQKPAENKKRKRAKNKKRKRAQNKSLKEVSDG